MKKILIISLFVLFVAGNAFSQGNSLVFNQVLTFAKSNVTVSPYVIGTVPAGKVWKIEYMGSFRNSYVNTFSINTGSEENEYSVFAYETLKANPTPHGPIWLKAGDVLKIYLGNGSYPITYFVSVIEFNIVPL